MAGILRDQGYPVTEIYFKDWKNNTFIPPTPTEIDNLVKVIEDQKIQLVAFSLRASAYLQLAADLTGIIRERTGLPILWGGAHVILCPDECITLADYICSGEGDRSLPELVEALDKGANPEKIPGIWVRRKEKIIKNPPGDLVCNLDSLPFRDYTSPDKFIIDGRQIRRQDPMINDPIFQMMTTRGCPYKCSYCYNSTFKKIFEGRGKYYRSRSVDNVIEELKLAKKNFPNLRRIKFDDEVFPFDPDWVEEFIEKYPREINLPFEAFTEPNLVDRKRFTRLKEAGLKIIYMGVQNSARITGTLYDRHTPDEIVLKAVTTLHEIGLDARYQIILDDPLSTGEDQDALFCLLMKFPRPFELYLFSLTIFPRTQLAKKLLEDGVIEESQVEGKDTKTFRQLRVDLSYPRSPESTYWAAMLVLLTKSFIPKSLLWKFYKNRKLKESPMPLVILAQLSNLVKMGCVALEMILSGELTWAGARRWLNFGSLITQ